MSAKRFRNRGEQVALLEYREALNGNSVRDGEDTLPDLISADQQRQDGSARIPLPEAGAAADNDAAPAIFHSVLP
jgi:hypothetical protein